MCRQRRVLSFIRQPRRDVLRFSTTSRFHTINPRNQKNTTSEPQASPSSSAVQRDLPEPGAFTIRRLASAPRPSVIQLSDAPNVDLNLDLSLMPAKDAPFSGCRNRGVLLTGGTGGIGSAVAERLIKEGAGRVVLICRDATKGNAVVNKIKQRTKLQDAPISILETDVTNDDTLRTLINNFPSCNTLINCAGIAQNRPLFKVSAQDEAKILETNLQAPMSLSRLFLAHYIASRRRRSGIKEVDHPPGVTENMDQSYCVVNVSSLLAIKGGVGAVAYATAKAGLIAQTRGLSLEASRFLETTGARTPFRANVILPGYIDTPMIASFDDGTQKWLKTNIPLRRFGSPEEVADAIVFLITNEYANNCVLNLDGGLSAV